MPRFAFAVAVAFLLTAVAGVASAEQTESDSGQALVNQFLAETEEATWIKEGDGPRVLYIFIDPNCPYCHKLWRRLRPYVTDGDYQVRWVLVGNLEASSLGKAAAILQADDRLAALRRNEKDFGFNAHDPRGAIDPVPEDAIQPQARSILDAHHALMNKYGLPGVPFTVFRAESGNAFFFQGAPPPDKLGEILERVASTADEPEADQTGAGATDTSDTTKAD